MDALQTPPLTMCVSKATLAASGAATTWSTTGATLYCIKGKAYTTSAASSAAGAPRQPRSKALERTRSPFAAAEVPPIGPTSNC